MKKETWLPVRFIGAVISRDSRHLILALLAGMGAGFSSPAQSTLITFDDLHTADYIYAGNYAIPVATYVPALGDGYVGLSWSNFYAMDCPAYVWGGYGRNSGFGNAVVSANNVAFNRSGNPAAIESGTPFNLDSGYFTAAWNHNLNLEVQGFNGTNLLYDQTYILDLAGPVFINLDYEGITSALFISYGGTGNGIDAPGTHFAVDNLTVSMVPEPSSTLLAGIGGMVLLMTVRFKRHPMDCSKNLNSKPLSNNLPASTRNKEAAGKPLCIQTHS